MKCIICFKSFKVGSKVSFHSFPKNAVLKQQWLTALGLNADEEIVLSTKVCSKHFSKSSIQWDRQGGKRILKKDAVPSLCVRSVRNILPLSNTDVYNEHSYSEVSSTETSSEILDSHSIDLPESENNLELTTLIQDVSLTSLEFIHPVADTERCFNISASSPTTQDFDEPLQDFEILPSVENKVAHVKRKLLHPMRVCDITEEHLNTPNQIKTYLEIIKIRFKEQSKKIKKLRNQNWHLNKKVMKLTSIVDQLQNINLVQENSVGTTLA